MPKPEQTVWRRILAAVASDHFNQSDVVLLTEFCRAAALADRAAKEIEAHGPIYDERVSPWVTVQEKAQRALVALAGKLRLCPQSRFDRLKAGTNTRGGVPDYLSAEDADLLYDRPAKLTGLASFRKPMPR